MNSEKNTSSLKTNYLNLLERYTKLPNIMSK